MSENIKLFFQFRLMFVAVGLFFSIHTTQSCAPNCEAVCTEHGACLFDIFRGCVAKEDKDCEQSVRCKESGACGFKEVGTSCVAKKLEHCLQSSNCKNFGRCSLKIEENVCIIQGTDDCKTSQGCQNEGRCTYEKARDICVVGGDADCLNSGKCKNKNCLTRLIAVPRPMDKQLPDGYPSHEFECVVVLAEP